MLCSACRALPPEIRCYPGLHAVAAAPGDGGGLEALVCERCGHAVVPGREPPGLVDVLVRLERAGLGVAGPLLGRPGRARAA